MKENISKKVLREFGFLICIAFPLLIGWLLPLLGGHTFRVWTLFISLPSGILGILKPSLLLYPYKLWMNIGHILGWVNSRLILGLVFLIVLFPISLIMRVFGHDPLGLKKHSQISSYREMKTNKKVNFKKIF